MKNHYIIGYEYTTIFVVHKGSELEVLVDNDVFQELASKNRTITARQCGKRIYFTCSMNGKNVYLHRLIADCPGGKVVDHINHNTADNRRTNLRAVSRSENMLNQEKLFGVGLRSDNGKWRARIFVDGKEISLGNFHNYEDAVESRRLAELTYFPEIARVADVS